MFNYAAWSKLPYGEVPSVDYLEKHALVLHDFGHVTIYIDEDAQTIYRYELAGNSWSQWHLAAFDCLTAFARDLH
jgi:hypothetical protein